jgi:hypothetical protein
MSGANVDPGPSPAIVDDFSAPKSSRSPQSADLQGILSHSLAHFEARLPTVEIEERRMAGDNDTQVVASVGFGFTY